MDLSCACSSASDSCDRDILQAQQKESGTGDDDKPTELLCAPITESDHLCKQWLQSLRQQYEPA